MCSHRMTLWSLTWGGIVFYWSTIRKQFEGQVKVISRSHCPKLLPWSHIFFRAVPVSFSNVSSLKGAWASVWWHLYNFSRITSIYINLNLCRWAISDNLKTDQNFIIVISINLIGFSPIGYTFTSLHVAIMSPSISLVNKTVSFNSGPHLIIIYRPTVDKCIV